MRKTIHLLFLVLALPLGAQLLAHRVRDLNDSGSGAPISSHPGSFVRFGSRVFFTAKTKTGTELWSTDGTASGTAQVADIQGGPESSNPSHFAILNGKLMFTASDALGVELWSTDGTNQGTQLVANIRSGSQSSDPGENIVYQDKMLFSATTDTDGRELWITDGTTAGTRLLKDLGPQWSDPHSFVHFNGLVYFAANSTLWKTDGTEGGTVPVKADVVVGPLAAAGSHIFFVGLTPDHGNELWVSDGTEAGTKPITNLEFVYRTLVPFGDRVLLTPTDSQSGTELWISDGTTAGTSQVRDIAPDAESAMAIAGGTAFFVATNPETGAELWRTDGSSAGTTLVADLVPGPEGSKLRHLTAAGEKLFFTAQIDGVRTPWVTDGTPGGTHVVGGAAALEIAPFVDPSLTNIDGTLYFSAANALNGYEPWKSDGSDSGTSMIANIAQDSAPSLEPQGFIVADDFLYFFAGDPTPRPGSGLGAQSWLWRTDGTSDGTFIIHDEASPITKPITAGRTLFFHDVEHHLWTSDGTRAGTDPLDEFSERFESPPRPVFSSGDRLYVQDDQQSWVTTLDPSAPIVKLPVRNAGRFTEVAGKTFFFAATEQNSDVGLWITDGTPAGTLLLRPQIAAADTPVVAGGHIYFTACGPECGLWKSDGTYDGTSLVVLFTPGIGATYLTPAGKQLFFISGGALWVTNGTAEGTRKLPARPLLFTFTETLAVAGDRVVFKNLDDLSTGARLWSSDGTIEGTRMVRDMYPGALLPVLGGFVSAGPVAFFGAGDAGSAPPTGGLWMTDGTLEGTRFATELPSYSEQFVRASGNLFFTARTTPASRELWVLPILTGPRLMIHDTRITEGDAGTRMARFAVTMTGPATQNVSVEYATADGTAVAGSDYDAVSGVLTFAPGEISKNIDVPVRGDLDDETAQLFSVELRNSPLTIERRHGVAIIEDDDQIADVSLSLEFARGDHYQVLVHASNHGPRAATQLDYRLTATPVGGRSCTTCEPVILPGRTVRAFENGSSDAPQQYLSATATARERDPQAGNNSVGWITNGLVKMDALYLTPGSEAKVWFLPWRTIATASVESSNPAVLAVPSSVALPGDGNQASFVVRGLSAGTAVIRIFTPAETIGTLTVDVLPSETKPRFRGGITSRVTVALYGKPVIVRLETNGTAPYTGATATGVVIISVNGQERARETITSKIARDIPIDIPEVGTYSVTIDYSGDANFLPSSAAYQTQVVPGIVGISASTQKRGDKTFRVRVAGDPKATPSGTVRVWDQFYIASVLATLVPVSPGVAEAEVTFANFPAASTSLAVDYSGDTHYRPLTSRPPITIDGRKRSVRH